MLGRVGISERQRVVATSGNSALLKAAHKRGARSSPEVLLGREYQVQLYDQASYSTARALPVSSRARKPKELRSDTESLSVANRAL